MSRTSHRLRPRLAALFVVVAALASTVVLGSTATIASADTAGNLVVTKATTPHGQTDVAPNGPLTNIASGDTITVNVSATGTGTPANVIFGVEARLCRPGLSISLLSQFNASAGNCISSPLAVGTSAYVQVPIGPPNTAGTLNFIVGTGTESSHIGPGNPITCDAANPCSLWIREQVPTGIVASGNAFVHYDINFAGATTVPSAPAAPTATAGDAQATVNWVAPADGGSPITSYDVTPYIGATAQTPVNVLAPATSKTITGLTNNTAYTFKVAANNANGPGPQSPASNTVTPTAATGSLFHSLDPVRIVDSRPGSSVGGFTTPWGPGVSRDIQVGGVGGVPANADAVVLNVTVTGPTGVSFLSVWPTGQTRPLVSSLNYAPGQTVPNQVTVKLGTGGKVSLFNFAGSADVIADVNGYFDTGNGGDGFTSLDPVRIVDSRPGSSVGGFTTPWGAGISRDISVGGVGGVPADADAVVLNVTVTGPTGVSFLSAWPAGQTRPLVSSLNYAPGQTVPNAVTVKLGTGGKVSIFNFSGSADVIVDVNGYFKSGTGAAFHPLNPVRIQDSRPGGPAVGAYTTPWGAGTSRDVAVGGTGGVPANAAGAVLNVTVTGPTAVSFLSVWPAGQTRPLVSSLNYSAGQTVPNAVTAKLGTAGKISVFNFAGNADVIADVNGYYG